MVLAAFLTAAVATAADTPTTNTWDGGGTADGDGSWNTATNWAPDGVPDAAATAIAVLPVPATRSRTVTVDRAVAVRELHQPAGGPHPNRLVLQADLRVGRYVGGCAAVIEVGPHTFTVGTDDSTAPGHNNLPSPAGTGVVAKTGTGTYSLGYPGAPPFTGTFRVENGTLVGYYPRVNNAVTVQVNPGATFKLVAAADRQTFTNLVLSGAGFNNAGAFCCEDNATFNDSSWLLAGDTTINVTAGRTLTIDGSGGLRSERDVVLTKIGEGRLQLGFPGARLRNKIVVAAGTLDASAGRFPNCAVTVRSNAVLIAPTERVGPVTVEPGGTWQKERAQSPVMGELLAAPPPPLPWNLAALSEPPQVFQDPTRSTNDVRAIFYAGLPWQGKPTRVFAYYGIPETAAGKKVPAMVLVHGGGGSAYLPWVRLWLSRGYAAIAMDTCGAISGGGHQNHPRHEHGGPPGWGGFDQLDEPPQDQWTYHAVADVILAHSLLRSLPQVDPDKIGLTGISWGGYLACIVAGVDPRFKFAAPVYGCGFLADNSVWVTGFGTQEFPRLGPAKTRQWSQLWDPAMYLRRAQLPLLWVTGANDFAYPLDSLQKSYRLPRGPRALSVRVGMAHGHGGPGENPPEIYALAQSLFAGGAPLARITAHGHDDRRAWARVASAVPIKQAQFHYTTGTGLWQSRVWKTVPAAYDTTTGQVSAPLPEGVAACYFNVIDDRDLVVSSEHEDFTR